ncbi:MAG: triose-phosphate isomerase [Candidatus Pacearchaeota archaeon]
MNVINFKAYKQGRQVIDLAKQISRYDRNAILCVQAVDIFSVSKAVKNLVFAQHVDSREKGRNTGFVILEAIKSAGAKGTLINHSEHRINFKDIKLVTEKCKKLNLKTIVFISELKEVNKIKKLKPWAIAYEDPYLVGTGKPITKYKAENVKKFAEILKKTGIISLCGAGISSREDIIMAKKLGCKGVAIGSAIAEYGRVEILK